MGFNITLKQKANFGTYINSSITNNSDSDNDGDNQGKSAIKICTQDTLVKYEIITK